MSELVALVVTSISSPNRVLRELAQGCQQRPNTFFIVIGDEASPSDFQLDGCEFYDLKQQVQSGFKFAELCPTRLYSRKNIGYLLAIRRGASIIVETDDDNIPYETFWESRQRKHSIPITEQNGWVNVYRYFTDVNIWPRGLPLDAIHSPILPWDSLEVNQVDCPIQQGLADDDPDVDAIYRLVLSSPLKFRKDRRLAVKSWAWCPFNSQNTTWWQEAYPLLYLPSYCPFRMTDIWRSFVAQAIAWANGWAILFHEPTMWQERNEHNLMRDFQQEVEGYLRNREFCQALQNLDLAPGVDKLSDNMRICYEKLVSLSIFDKRELNLLDAWLDDVEFAMSPKPPSRNNN